MELQKRHLILADCRINLNFLIESIDDGADSSEHIMHGRNMGKQYIAINSETVVDKDFECGIVKLQEGRCRNLTHSGKRACKRLLKILKRLICKKVKEETFTIRLLEEKNVHVRALARFA